MPRTVADSICSELISFGVTDVFGLPGSQTIDLWEALRRSGLRTVVPTSELSASFMAGGYARASGRPGALVTIGEPGFTFALSGVVESLLDSVPLLHIASPSRRVAPGPSGELRQDDVARLVYKAVFEPAEPADVPGRLNDAIATTTAGEPGPVLVQLAPALLGATAPNGASPATEAPTLPDRPTVDQLVDELRRARRPLLFCGNGVSRAAKDVVRLAESLSAPVLTTTSGRGVIPETHPLSLPHDVVGADVTALNELIRACDLVLVLGARLSHNGSRGGALVLPEESLVRVDASAQVLGAGYPARLEVVCDAPTLVSAMADDLERERGASTWNEDEIARWNARLEVESLPRLAVPRVGGVSASQFFVNLREVVPDGVPVATDSGLHQYLVRAHFPVVAPRTLLVPTDFQSMGFGVPTAIGASLATDGPAIAVVGDGGFNINATELLTAVRERIALTVIVLVDRQLGLIRAQQLRRTGRPSGVDIPGPDLERFAESVGADYLPLPDGDASPLRETLRRGAVTVVELPATDTGAARRAQARGLMVATGRKLLGPRSAAPKGGQ